MKEKFTDRNLQALINEMNCLWGGIFITGGGAITLLLTKINIATILISLIGFFFCISFTSRYFDKRLECDALIKYLNKSEAE